MLRQASLRKLIMDLTPLIDMVMIVMFGVMINSVHLSRGEGQEAQKTIGDVLKRSESDRKFMHDAMKDLRAQVKEQEKERKELLGKKDEELKKLLADRDAERLEAARVLARLLQRLDDGGKGLDADILKKLLAEKDLSKSGSRRIKAALENLENDPAAAHRAIRRLVEMEKVFTFVDFHLDGNDQLHATIDGVRSETLPMRGVSAADVESKLRNNNLFQTTDWNRVVLFMYSNEAQALDQTFRSVEQGIKNFREYLQKLYAGKEKDFRYAPIGTVSHAPPAISTP